MPHQSEQQEGSHLLMNGLSMIISPDIVPVFTFLMEIEKEIESLLGFNKKLDGIKDSYLEMVAFVQFLSNKLKENHIDFSFNFKEHPEKIADKLGFHIPLRSQMIVLFASLDVLFNLHTVYENETCDNDKLRDLTMNTDNTKKFLNCFLLNEDNQYYKDNKIRLSKIDSGKLRNLRNSLTHFFSTAGGLFITPELLREKATSFEKTLKQNKHGNIVSISPDDLHELVKSANILQMRKWSDDFKNSSADFKRKIQFVIDVVKREGAIVVLDKDTNIK